MIPQANASSRNPELISAHYPRNGPASNYLLTTGRSSQSARLSGLKRFPGKIVCQPAGFDLFFDGTNPKHARNDRPARPGIGIGTQERQ